MSRLTRVGTTESVSRDQILRRGRGQGIVHFPCSAIIADREQDWQPCPVVMVIHINKLYIIHTAAAVVTHICIYSSEPCTNVHVPR